jgi:hypothetical protein
VSNENIESIIADAQALIDSVRAKTGEVRAERDARAKKNSESRKNVESARRTGELGRAWQSVQQRIDLGKTTMDDVINGSDLSPEAKALRLMIQKTLPAARAEFATQADAAAEDGEFVAMQRAQAELASELDRSGPSGTSSL